MELKTCSTCGTSKELSEFQITTQNCFGYKSSCRKCLTAYRKKLDNKNKEQVRQYAKDYYKNNKSKYETWRKQLSYHYSGLKAGAKKRNLALEITYDEYIKIVENKNCYYCDGSLPSTGHGLDRTNNSIHYTINNVVACCSDCNFMKTNMNKVEFISHCKKIANKFKE